VSPRRSLTVRLRDLWTRFSPPSLPRGRVPPHNTSCGRESSVALLAVRMPAFRSAVLMFSLSMPRSPFSETDFFGLGSGLVLFSRRSVSFTWNHTGIFDFQTSTFGLLLAVASSADLNHLTATFRPNLQVASRLPRGFDASVT